jgi:RNA polymerase sigma factor (sigma-70 family)
MNVPSRGGLFGFITRLGRPPNVDSDADLLDRFVQSADDAAFTGIVRRHGLMVLAVCRRRLTQEADAEDAFQAVFLALAKSACSIGRRESLTGWLYRVAYLISLKAAGIRSRQPVASWPTVEVPMPNQTTTLLEADELKAAIDEELARLPDKFRSVVALCLIEGRTNVEAATILGIPVGTIDSRLHSAKKRLGARLARRGIGVGGGVSLSQLLAEPLAAADGSRFLELVSRTVPAVLTEVTGPGTGAVSHAVSNLAQGVTVMTTTRLRLFAAVGIAIGLLGGTATGIYLATAADPPKQTPDQITKTQDAPLPVVAQAKTPTPATNSEPISESGPLSKPLKKLKLDATGSICLKGLFETLEDETDLIVRVDVGAFRRLGLIGGGDAGDQATFLIDIYNTKAILPRRANMLPVRDVLSDALAQVNQGNCTYQVRGSQLVIMPSYQTPSKPGVDPLNPIPERSLPGQDVEDVQFLAAKMISEQIYGGVVSVSADKKPLTEILADLRKQTGANIVFDPRCETLGKAGEKKANLTIALNDVRLYDALRVIADLAELKMVYAGNIYYVTTPENAKAFQPAPVVRPIVYQNPFWPQSQMQYPVLGNPGVQPNNPAPVVNPPPATNPKQG